MVAIVGGWAFAAFLYLKIALDAEFYNGVSVLAALLMAVLLGLLVFFLSGFYAMSLAKGRASTFGGSPQPRSVIKATLVPFLCGAIIYPFVCRMVAFGFSKDLSRQINIFEGYRKQLNEDFVMFAAIVLVPLLLHYLMVVLSARRMATG